MDFYRKALSGSTAKGVLARKIEPSIKTNDEYSKVNRIFSKPSYTMPDILFIASLVERQADSHALENA